MRYISVTSADLQVMRNGINKKYSTNNKYKKGDRIVVLVDDDCFLATVTSVKGGQIYLLFDDGDNGKVSIGSKRILGRGIDKKVEKPFSKNSSSKYILSDKSDQDIYKVYIGYWKGSEEDSAFPMPTRKWRTSNGDKDDFYTFFDKFLRKMKRKKCHGHSICRICKKNNEADEYIRRFQGKTSDGKKVEIRLTIPSGYMHYIKNHNINAPVDFLKKLSKNDIDGAIEYLIPIDSSEGRVYIVL